MAEILIHGSRTLVHSLRAVDLIDRYRVTGIRLVLGPGFRRFGATSKAMQQELTDVDRF